LTGHGGPQGCGTLRFQHFLKQSADSDGEVSLRKVKCLNVSYLWPDYVGR
jgi:hypothetical protein